MSVVSRLLNVRRKCVLVVRLAVLAFASTAALAAGAATTPGADLATTITAHGTSVQGGYIGYTITVTNNGPDTASGVIMTDHTPASMWSRYPTIFYCVGSVPPVGSGQGWCGPLPSGVSCTAPHVGSTGTVSCTTSSLASGASMTLEMAIQVGFYMHNQAVQDTATATSSTFDPNTANNTAGVAVNGVTIITYTGPVTVTGSASGVRAGSATVSGTVNPNGLATTYQFDYGTSTNYGSQAPAPPDPSAGSGTTAQTESAALTGLSQNTVYHYRIEATNQFGTSYGADQTFTTTAAGAPLSPTVATGSASGVGAGSATVSGIVNPNGLTTTYHFEYGTSTNYTSHAPAPPDPSAGSGTTAQTESTALAGLAPNTIYHYRIEATNGLGTSYGADQTFTTTGPPAAATGAASGVGTVSATVSGTVNPNGAATTYHFDYGTSTNYGSHAPAPPDPSAGSGTTAQTESAALTGLAPNTVYHYRIEATNQFGTSYGADQTFTTTASGTSPIPIVSTGLAVNVASTAATVWGTVDDRGEVATYRFDYGTSTNYTSQTISEQVFDSNSTPTSVDARLTGLSPNTLYHYRIEATDAWGTSYGADQTFTTTS